MANTNLVNIPCPKCGKIYRIYRENIGRAGICKKCTTRFTMVPRKKNTAKKTVQKFSPVVRSAPNKPEESKVMNVIDADKDISNKAEIQTNKKDSEKKVIDFEPVSKKDISILRGQLKVTVENKMKAYLIEKKPIDSDLNTADLKKFLKQEKIVYGIVSDEQLQLFIDKKINRISPWLVAQGSEPSEPTHGKIKYLFDTNPLKPIHPDNSDADDRIDYKERGELPYIEKSTLIAERVPGIPGKHGKDIYGKRIDAKKAQHATIRCGGGAELSEDKRLVHARISGMPVLTKERHERVDVVPQFYVNGDVNMKTGNIRFNGPVVVKGTVQSGFKIRCASLDAKELFRADVQSEGDITIQNGVVGAKIACQGEFKAKFVKGSSIFCEQDITVTNGIVDSNIETRSKCIVKKNKILTSTIIALKEIVTLDLGSKSSPGCQLTIGTDPLLYKEMEQLKAENQSLAEKLADEMEEQDIDDLSELEKDYASITQKINTLDPVYREAKEIIKNLLIKYKSLKKQNKNDKKLVETIRKFSAKIGPAKAELTSLNCAKDTMATWLHNIKDIQGQIEKNTAKIQEINRQIQTADHNAKVIVQGEVFSGTMIQGVNSCIEVYKNQARVEFEEIQIINDNNMPERQIECRPLKD